VSDEPTNEELLSLLREAIDWLEAESDFGITSQRLPRAYDILERADSKPQTAADLGSFYEILPEIKNERTYDEWLTAAFTPNNGIRITIVNRDDVDEINSDKLCSFDFEDDQAEMIGQALVRWARCHRAEREIIRCGMDKSNND
jgi:hypothetical protein